MQLTPIDRGRAFFLRHTVSRLLRNDWARGRIARRRREVDGRILDETLGAILEIEKIETLGAPDLATARRNLARQILAADDPPIAGVSTRDLTIPVDGAMIDARLYVPDGLGATSPGVVYFHGGGWALGDLDTHDAAVRRIARGADARVVAVAYRLAPEHPFPTGIEDAVAAFRYIAATSRCIGVDPSRIAVMGDSAGGNLAAVVALRTRGDAVRPVLQALVYPGVDATLSSPSHATLEKGFFLERSTITWFLTRYLGPALATVRHPDASPIFSDDVTGAPPAYVATAGFDPLRDEGARYAAKLADAGVSVSHREFPDLVHGFFQMGGIVPAARAATAEIVATVASLLRA